MPSDQPPVHSRAINSSPLFDTPDGWSSGFALATGHGPGVVVGPGKNSPNVFAQSFPTKPNQQYKVVARASSVDASEAMGAIQINWHDGEGKFISVSQEIFKVIPAEKTFQNVVVAPRDARQGTLYVAPGGSDDTVRYTEMTLSRLEPFDDVETYRIFGVEGQNLAISGATIFLFVVLYAFYRKRLLRTGALLGNGVIRILPLLALMLCGVLFYFLKGPYDPPPLFDTPNGWSSSFPLVAGHGPGVVVGPGTNNPNVFAQAFPAKPSEQYRVVARASSVEKTEAMGLIQINWNDATNKFISASKEYFKVTPAERRFRHTVIAPPDTATGVLYVVPGGQRDVVRYNEMTLSRLEPFADFMAYRFFGVKGQNLAVPGAVIFLFVVLHAFYRKRLFGTGALLGNGIARILPVLALMSCGALLYFLEGPYKPPPFDTPNGWSSSFAMVTGHGPGVVVGPGTSNPNVLAQAFPATPSEQYSVVARASSVDKSEAMGVIQINWNDANNKFISASMEYFKVTPAERTFQHTAIAPPGTANGVFYVVPGGQTDVVRYKEMTLSRLEPFADFMAYRFFGVEGQKLAVSGAVIILFVVLYAFCREQLLRIGALVGNSVIRIFPLLAMMLCGAMFYFLEGHYEQHYDSAWHQVSVESVMQWNDVSLDLGGSPLHNFGIQHVINPQLSPTFWIGSIVPPDHRIPVQAAFQAMVLFAILVQTCRLAGARLADASAISLIAVYYLCVPYLSDNSIALNATLGLLWQEGAIATLLAFFCFARIGYGDLNGKAPWPIFGLVATVLWFILAYPELIAFFTLATAGLCLGALIGVQSRGELLYKSRVAAALVAGLLLVGFHNYVLNLFLYTPQMYYRTLYNHDFASLFFTNTSLLLSSARLGGAKIIAFFILAGIGAYFALRLGNGFARRVVFGGLALEAAIHFLSGINAYFKLIPLTFTYVEQMGLTIIALLAATGTWVMLRLGLQIIAKCFKLITPGIAELVTSNRRP